MAPQVGERALEFSLPSTEGGELSLRQLLATAQHVIIAFYPKDNTSG